MIHICTYNTPIITTLSLLFIIIINNNKLFKTKVSHDRNKFLYVKNNEKNAKYFQILASFIQRSAYFSCCHTQGLVQNETFDQYVLYTSRVINSDLRLF